MTKKVLPLPVACAFGLSLFSVLLFTTTLMVSVTLQDTQYQVTAVACAAVLFSSAFAAYLRCCTNRRIAAPAPRR